MNAEQLLKHFDRISEAPDAIARLRRFILNLAVRGKLVEQDPYDEPASELLKRIQAEKVRLLKDGKLRKQDGFPSVEIFEQPFTLPNNWIWCRLGEIGDWGSGSTPPRGDIEYYRGAITWLKSGELGDSLSLRDSEEKISKLALERCSFRLNQPGDVLIAMYGATIGKLAILAECAVTNQAVCGCTPLSGIFNKYLFIFLLSRRDDFLNQGEGGAQPNISKIKIVTSPFALPTLPEQHRIVAKVDELMSLCDQLEAARNEREAQRNRLVASSLNRISQAPAASEENEARTKGITILRDAARFHLDHLPLMVTRPEHVKQLRQTILDLAVRGRLVPQDPNDEPVSELLKTILEEKKRLAKIGITKDDKLTKEMTIEGSYAIPKTWQWVRFGIAVNTHFGGGTPSKSNSSYWHGDICWASVKDVGKNKYLDSTIDHITDDGLANSSSTLIPPGNLIIVTRMGLGKLSINRISVAINQDLRAIILTRFSSIDFFYTFFKTHEFSGTGLTVKGIKIEELLNAPFPLPPLAEQHRIVAKVDELLALCDKLDSQVKTTEADSRRFMEAILRDALEPTKTLLPCP